MHDFFAAHLVESTVHAAEPNVGQVLDPLEVRHDHAARVDVAVGQDGDAALREDLVTLERHGAVGGLHHELGLDAVGVGRRDLLLQRGGDEDVARQLERSRAVRRVLPASESFESGLVVDPGTALLDVEALCVRDDAVTLDDRDDPCVVFLREKLRSMKPDVAESLHDDLFPGEAGRQPGLSHIVRMAEELA